MVLAKEEAYKTTYYLKYLSFYAHAKNVKFSLI